MYKAIQKDVVIRRLTKGLATIGVLFLLWAPIEAVAFATPSSYPEAAVEFLQNHYPNAVVLNHYNWGGYLIWARPEGKVFIDGRMPSWRWQAPAGELDWAHRDWTAIGKGDKTLFEKDVALFGIDTVLWTTPWAGKSDLLNLLKDEGWLPVYADEIAVIYRKPGSNP